MKHLSTPVNQIAIFERVIHALKAIETTPVATASEIQQQVMPDVTKRAVQRYLKNLVQMGLLYAKHSEGLENRYYLSGKAKQLFEVKG